MGAYYLALLIVAFISIAIGWVIGWSLASKSNLEDQNKVDEEMAFLVETNNLITTEELNLINAENNLNLLLDIEFGKLNSAKKLLIEELQQYYKTTKESINDGFANEGELVFINRLHSLANADKNIKQVVK